MPPTIRSAIPRLPGVIRPERRLRREVQRVMDAVPSIDGLVSEGALTTAVGQAKAEAIAAIPPSLFLMGDFTVATLPAASENARKYAWATDLFGGPGDICLSDGVVWKPVRPYAVNVVANANAAMTLTAMLSAPTQVMAGVLTANRTITLSTTHAHKGARFRIKRTATGLFSLLIGGVGLPLNNWVDWEFDGTAWVQTASGGLL